MLKPDAGDCPGVRHGTTAGAGQNAEHGAHAAHRNYGAAGSGGPDWRHLPGSSPLPPGRPGLTLLVLASATSAFKIQHVQQR